MSESERRSRSSSGEHERFTLRTVARLTGLTPDLIRAWERRYAVVRPVRGPRGTRLYRTTDIERLQLLAAVVNSGRSIGDVARLADEQLNALLERNLPTRKPFLPAADSAPAENEGSPELPATVSRVLDAVERFNQAEVERLLGEALIALGPFTLAERVLAPMLEEVGSRWLSGKLTVAHEHFLSAILREFLSGVLRIRRGPSGQPRALLATPEGEVHEFGLLLAALTLADSGVQLCYLGSSVPAGDLVLAASRLNVRVVALSVVTTSNRARAVEAVNFLLTHRTHSMDIWLGGADAVATTRAVQSRKHLTMIRTLSELRQHAQAYFAGRGSSEPPQSA